MKTTMNATERVIREQFDFWRRAPKAQFTAEAGKSYAVVGCGTSVHVSKTVAAVLCHQGFDARAVTGNEWTRRPHDAMAASIKPDVLAFSRSGESSELVRAAIASRKAGLHVTGFTCTIGSSLARESSRFVHAETHAEEDIVMTSAASLLLLMGMRFAGLTFDIDAAATAAETTMKAFDAKLGKALDRRSHFVFLGGGPLYGIACEAGLKLQEMSLSQTEAHHPLEYRHGPVSLIDKSSFVTMLYHPDTLAEETLLAEELRAKGAFVVGFGGPGDLSFDLPADALTRGLIVLPALQILGERRAQARGIDSAVPRHLTKVVRTA